LFLVAFLLWFLFAPLLSFGLVLMLVFARLLASMLLVGSLIVSASSRLATAVHTIVLFWLVLLLSLTLATHASSTAASLASCWLLPLSAISSALTAICSRLLVPLRLALGLPLLVRLVLLLSRLVLGSRWIMLGRLMLLGLRQFVAILLVLQAVIVVVII